MLSGPGIVRLFSKGFKPSEDRKDNARSNRDTDTLLRLGSPARPPSPSLRVRLQGDENNWILSSMDIDHRRLRHSDSKECGLLAPDAHASSRTGWHTYRISRGHNDHCELDSQPRRRSSPLSRIFRTCPKIPKPSKEQVSQTSTALAPVRLGLRPS